MHCWRPNGHQELWRFSVTRRLAWYEKHGLKDKLIQSDERGGFDSTKVDEIIREHLLP